MNPEEEGALKDLKN